MSNLGLYQTMTTIAKKVGGPGKLLVLTLAGGYAIGKTGEIGVKKIVKSIKKDNTCKNKNLIFEVKNNGEYKDGLNFVKGDKFKVLESDKDSILIEKIGDSNNPYFVPADFLESISDFKK